MLETRGARERGPSSCALKGKVAIVTGASSGIGAATARRLAEAGAQVCVGYNAGRVRAEGVVAELSGSGHRALHIRLEDSATIRDAAEAVRRVYGRCDILVNSAGFTRPIAHGDLDALDDAFFDSLLIATVRGPFSVIRAFAPLLRESGNGVIVNVSSVSAFTALGSSVAYCATKAALDNMTMSLARALGPEIRVNAVCPAFIEGRWLVEGMGQERYEAYKKNLVATVTLRHAMTPDDVAQQIYWFIDGASVVTGQVLVTDAGFTLGPVPAHSAAGSENRAERQKERAS